MDVLIKETGEEKYLAVIDWKTGGNYAAELVVPGLPEDEGYDDMGRIPMGEETFAWWETVLAEYQNVEDAEEEAFDILSGQEWGEMTEELDFGGSRDIEDYPKYALETINKYLTR